MIKNIIFDVGEVLLGYRWHYILELSGLAPEDGVRVFKEIFESKIWRDLDAGDVMLTDAKELFREKYPEEGENIEFFLSHPELMPIARPEVWEQLPKLKDKGYKLYVLSNYGKELFEMHTAGSGFLQYMDGGVISYEVHVCKPDAAIYKALLDKYSLNPEECVFYDDKAENIDGAAACGIKGVRIQSEDMLLSELEKLLGL